MAIKKIDIGKLRIGMSLANPVYGEIKNKRVLLLHAGTTIENESQIRHLKAAGVKNVEIDTVSGKDTFLSLLDQQRWEDVAKSKRDGKSTEAMITRYLDSFTTSATNFISNNFTSRTLIKNEVVANLMKEVILFVENNIDILIAMVRLKGISEFTFSHSVNTTVLCLSVATSLKLNYSDIKRFGCGVLLADLGMTSYPSRLIQRPSGLSRKEVEEIQKHPEYTVNFLKKNGVNDPLIETIIIQHHERFDGSGYPNGLKGEDIHAISKLFAIADVYNAMTSSRPHRQGIPPHMVNAEILSEAGTKFDPKITKLFIKHVGVFPVGNMVELTSGRLGLVADRNLADPLKPVVIVFQTKKKIKNYDKIKKDEPGVIITRGNWEIVDLKSDSGAYGRIRRGLDHRQYRINPEYYLSQV